MVKTVPYANQEIIVSTDTDGENYYSENYYTDENGYCVIEVPESLTGKLSILLISASVDNLKVIDFNTEIEVPIVIIGSR